MAVTYLGEDAGGRSAQNSKGTRTYTRVFKLETSSESDDAYDVGSNASLPLIGSTHPGDAGAWCISLRVENNNPWKGWQVTAEYSTERELNTNPTSDPAKITWETEQFQRPAIQDRDGNAITTSAGELFATPAQMDDSRRVVTVSKNLAVVPTWILDYQDAINSDTFTVDGVSIAVGKAKMQRVSVGAEEERNGTVFRVVTFQMHLQRDGWALSLLDAGWIVKNAIDPTKRERAIVDDGTDPSVGILLDGNGRPLQNPSPSTGVFRSFNVFKTRAFSSLPLT